jgi:hypothetical protein
MGSSNSSEQQPIQLDEVFQPDRDANTSNDYPCADASTDQANWDKELPVFPMPAVTIPIGSQSTPACANLFRTLNRVDWNSQPGGYRIRTLLQGSLLMSLFHNLEMQKYSIWLYHGQQLEYKDNILNGFPENKAMELAIDTVVKTQLTKELRPSESPNSRILAVHRQLREGK